MSRTTTSSWLKRIGLAGVAAAGLFAATLLSTPAQAQVVIGAPYYAPYYGYGYGYPGVYLGFGGGWHHHHRW